MKLFKKKMLRHFTLYTLNFLILKKRAHLEKFLSRSNNFLKINIEKEILILIVTKIYCNLLSMVGLIKLFLRSKLNSLLKHNVDL